MIIKNILSLIVFSSLVGTAVASDMQMNELKRCYPNFQSLPPFIQDELLKQYGIPKKDAPAGAAEKKKEEKEALAPAPAPVPVPAQKLPVPPQKEKEKEKKVLKERDDDKDIIDKRAKERQAEEERLSLEFLQQLQLEEQQQQDLLTSQLLEQLLAQEEQEQKRAAPNPIKVEQQEVPGAGKKLVIKKGHEGYSVPCEVNGKVCVFLYDTGATVTTLPYEDCAKYNIDVARLVFNHPIETANGKAFAAMATVNSLKVGEIKAFNRLRVIVAPAKALALPLIGQDVMEHLKCTTQNNIMTLE